MELKKKGRKIPLVVLGILAVMLAMLLLLWYNVSHSHQSVPAMIPEVRFEGQYRVGDGEWKTLEEGKHIPATRGDVTLRGTFHLITPDGEYIGPATPDTMIVFYINHIHVMVEEQGQPLYILDAEYESVGEDLCGEQMECYTLATSEPVTLIFHNPHVFGNENAIDEFLQELSLYAGVTTESALLAKGNAGRSQGVIFLLASFMLLGTALFSMLLQIGGSGPLWLAGLCTFFAGGYRIYGAKGVFLWSDSIIGNTTALGICMMLYMVCICALTATALGPKVRKVGMGAVCLSGATAGGIAGLCLVTDIRFYDTWLWWELVQSAVNLILIVCLAADISGTSRGKRLSHMGAGALLLAFEVDLVAAAFGWWQRGLASRFIFSVLFLVAMVMILQIVPRNFKAARKAREMEAEQKAIRAQLQEHRVAIMISQIQPHFIYNTLGTIQQLCKDSPQQAEKLVQNFSLYLRGNFSELDSTLPIPFAKELEHVRCYTDIELVRFPDMTVRYDIQTEAFLLPALTVQPLVENAIKHGLMGLEEGGTVTVHAFETPTHYCVRVADDGVGFDTAAEPDKKNHIGIRNVRERLEMMCGGTLTVESEKGKGTQALIRIPKEGNAQ